MYKKIIAKGYDRVYEKFIAKYGTLSESEKEYLDEFLELVRGPKILDIGCGPGKHSKYMKEKGYEVYSADISGKMVLSTKQINPYTLYADMEYLPFREEYFDGIWCNAALVHLPKKDKALSEFYRVLKDEGILYVSVQNLLYPRILKILFSSILHGNLRQLYYREVYWWPETGFNLKKLLRKHNFHIIKGSGNLNKWVRYYARKNSKKA